MGLIGINRNPTPGQLRLFGSIGLPVFAAVFGWLCWKSGAFCAAYWLWGIGAVSVVAGLLAPQRFRLLYFTLTYATFPLGWLVSHLALAVIYYWVLTPIGFLRRRLSGDPLKRAFDSNAKSYWEARGADGNIGRYFKQY